MKAGWVSSRPSSSHFAIDALETLALSPSSQTIGKASSAVLACHQVSATTATALSPTFTTFLTPFMSVTLASSKLFTLPPNTGQSLIAAWSIPGSFFADELPVLRILQLDVGWRVEPGGGFDHLAKGRRASRRRVRDHAVGGAAFRSRYIPFIRSRLDQHHGLRRA